MKRCKQHLEGTLTALALMLTAGASLSPSAVSASRWPMDETILASISDYNKVEALQAAIVAVQEQLPEAVSYWDMHYGSSEVRGAICWGNPREIQGIGCPMSLYYGTAFKTAIAEGLISEESPGKFLDGEDTFPKEYENKTFREIIDIAKNNAAYKTNTEFRQGIDEAELVYNRGVKALRSGLTTVNPTLTGLDAKNGDELAEIYDSLPSDKYEILVEIYGSAYGTVRFCEQIGDDFIFKDEAGCTNENFEATYAQLVTVAMMYDSNFAVDLSNVARLLDVPTAPDTGSNDRQETSTTVVRIAIIGVACVATGAGIAFIVKRYFFSSLKRRADPKV